MATKAILDHPVDTPIERAPGVTHREADFHGFADKGFGKGHAGSSAVGRAKGNRNWASFPRRQALTGGGPWTNLQ